MPLFDRHVLGLIIQDGKLVAADIDRKKGKIVLSGLVEADLPKNLMCNGSAVTGDQLGGFIHQQFQKGLPHKIEADSIVFEIPSEHLYHLILYLPKNLKRSELQLAASVEAQKSLPISFKDLVWRIRRCNMLGDQQGVFLTAVKKETVDEYYHFLREYDLIPLGFTSRVDNVQSALFEQDSGLTFVLDMGLNSTQLMLFHNHEPVHVVTFSAGEENFQIAMNRTERLNNFDDSPKVFDECLDILREFSNEVKSFFEHEDVKRYLTTSFVQHGDLQLKTPKAKFLYLGNTIYFRGFYDFFQNEALSFVELPSKDLQNRLKINMVPWIEKAPFFPALEGEKQKKSFFGHPQYQTLWVSALGAAQTDFSTSNGNHPSLNLLPHQGKTLAFLKMGEGFVKLAAILLMMISVCWMFVFAYAWTHEKSVLAVEKERYEKILATTESDEFQALKTRIDGLYVSPSETKERYGNREAFSRTYEEFRVLLAPTVEITQFELEQQNTSLKVEGFIPTREVYTAMFENIKASDLFTLTSPAPPAPSDSEIPFELILQLSP